MWHTCYRGDDFGGHNIPFPHPRPPTPQKMYQDGFSDIMNIFYGSPMQHEVRYSHYDWSDGMGFAPLHGDDSYGHEDSYDSYGHEDSYDHGHVDSYGHQDSYDHGHVDSYGHEDRSAIAGLLKGGDDEGMSYGSNKSLTDEIFADLNADEDDYSLDTEDEGFNHMPFGNLFDGMF